MTQEPKRRRGGQRKPAAERKRNNLTFRVRDQLRADLEQAAAANQRSVSEEIEHRIERSFVVDATLGDIEAFRRRAIAAEAHARGYGTLWTSSGPQHFPPGSHNIPQSGFITPQEAAAPPPAYGLPPAIRDAIRDEIRAVLAEAGLLRGKGAA
jgi:hypothetical protein